MAACHASHPSATHRRLPTAQKHCNNSPGRLHRFGHIALGQVDALVEPQCNHPAASKQAFVACRGHKELTRPPPLPLARSPLASPPAALSCRQPEWRVPRPPMPAPRPPPLPAPHPGNGPRGCQKLGRLQISWHGYRMHMCAAAMSHGMTAWHHSNAMRGPLLTCCPLPWHASPHHTLCASQITLIVAW